MGVSWGSPPEPAQAGPEPLAEQLARYDAHRRKMRRDRVLAVLLVIATAGAGVLWPPLLVGLWWLTAYCVVMVALWYAANRLAVRLGYRHPAPPAVPEPRSNVAVATTPRCTCGPDSTGEEPDFRPTCDQHGETPTALAWQRRYADSLWPPPEPPF